MNNRTMTELQYQALVLVQALIGVISPNFRMVWVGIENIVKINIILEAENEEDFDEIEDLRSEFEALQEKSIEYEIKISINRGELVYPDFSKSVIVFKRREV
ncbi:MAG: hypothetical protein ACTHY7_02445 [Marinobacter sp.]|uniref:hypothetical protein n=1 Tax=Marinobacter sp. TaxID=50741 RepID=UPI003F9E794C